MTDDAIKGRLIDLAIEMKDDVVYTLGNEDSPSCELCNDTKFQKSDFNIESAWEIYTIDCPCHNCGGTLSFSHLYVKVGEDNAIISQDFIAGSCSGDEVTGPEYLFKGAVRNNEPSSRTDYTLSLKKIFTTNIHEHHTSYVPEQTMLACAQCHMKIHNDEDFRPDLTPDMSRTEWEEQKDD